MRSPMRILLAAGAVTAALGFLAGTGSSLADEPSDTTAVTMTFERPEARGDEGGLTISVRMTNADGEPVARQPVEFLVTPHFLGELPVSIGTALSNAAGVATVTYTPTWEGQHRITARYGGGEAHQTAEVTSAFELTGVPSAEIPMDDHLSTLRQWATPGATATVLAVWLTLAMVVTRVGWGVWQAGRRRVQVPSSPETMAERLPGGTFGR